MKPLRCFISCLFIVPMFVQSEMIKLSEDELQKLDIEFAALLAVDNSTGVRLPATVMNSPDATASVTALYDGIVESWQAESGQSVQRGQVLATIRSQAFAELQRQWLSASADLEQADFDYEKDSQLFEKGIISKQQLVKTQRQLAKARADFQAAEMALTVTGMKEQQLSELKSGADILGNYVLRAPLTGVLTHRAYQVGQYIQANSVMAGLTMPDAMWVSVQVPSHMASSIEIGQSVIIEDSNETLTVKKKDFEIDPVTQTIEVFAEFDHQTQRMAGQILAVRLAPLSEGVLVPASAVVHTGQDTLVFKQTQSGIEPKIIQLVAAGEAYIARDGVYPGDRVAVRGAAILKGIQLGLGGGE